MKNILILASFAVVDVFGMGVDSRDQNTSDTRI